MWYILSGPWFWTELYRHLAHVYLWNPTMTESPQEVNKIQYTPSLVMQSLQTNLYYLLVLYHIMAAMTFGGFNWDM